MDQHPEHRLEPLPVVDFDALADMRAGTGTARIVDDVASALASGADRLAGAVVDGARYQGELDPGAVSAALEAVLRA